MSIRMLKVPVLRVRRSTAWMRSKDEVMRTWEYYFRQYGRW